MLKYDQMWRKIRASILSSQIPKKATLKASKRFIMSKWAYCQIVAKSLRIGLESIKWAYILSNINFRIKRV